MVQPSRASSFAKSAADVAAILVPGTLIVVLGFVLVLKPDPPEGRSPPGQESPANPPPPEAAQVGPAVAPGAPTEVAELAIMGQVDSIRAVPLSEIPPRSSALTFDLDCDQPRALLTPAAQLAVAAGWNVSADLQYETYSAVLIDSGYVRHPTRGCLSRDASLLIFEKSQLLAVIYDRAETTPDARFNRVSAESGGFRLFDSAGARADVRVDSNAIRLQDLPATDLRCGGHARVPRIERRDYLSARALLLDAGWQAPSAGPAELDFAGCTEAACRLEFVRVTGETLTIQTVSAPTSFQDQNGETQTIYPEIFSFNVTCSDSNT